MKYTFKNYPHHNIYLYNKLNIQINFKKYINIQKKIKTFKTTNKNKISIFHPYLKTIYTKNITKKFQHKQTNQNYIKILKNITILNYNTKIIYSQKPNTKITLHINKNPNY